MAPAAPRPPPNNQASIERIREVFPQMSQLEIERELQNINHLEENDFLFRSSKHHLTTVNSWRITEKTKKAFTDISKNKEINLNEFKKFIE